VAPKLLGYVQLAAEHLGRPGEIRAVARQGQPVIGIGEESPVSGKNPVIDGRSSGETKLAAGQNLSITGILPGGSNQEPFFNGPVGRVCCGQRQGAFAGLYEIAVA